MTTFKEITPDQQLKLIREAQAILKAKAKEEVEGNMMIITVSYNHLVMPYKDAMGVLACFEKAQMIEQRYTEKPRIKHVKKGEFSAEVISAKEYRQIQLSQLLDIPLTDLQEAEKAHEATLTEVLNSAITTA